MGLFEIMGESSNPGPSGDVTVGAPKPRSSPVARWARGIIAILLVGGVFTFIFWHNAFSWQRLGWTAGILAAYLAVGFFVRPRANTSNLGWAGGALDNPFRYSDDINRTLLFGAAILWPGRFIASSLVALVRPHRSRGWRPEPPLADSPRSERNEQPRDSQRG